MSFMALDLLLHVLILHHVMQFRIFYLVLLFLSGSQCQDIAPCYATLELIDFLEISLTILHHVMQFRIFYLVLLFLSGSQCQDIAPCYATLELIDFLEISLT